MEIKVLGTGCSKCKTLFANVEEALVEMGLEATLTKVEDMMEIMRYNIMVLPAIVVDEKVVAKGKVLSVNEVKEVLK